MRVPIFILRACLVLSILISFFSLYHNAVLAQSSFDIQSVLNKTPTVSTGVNDTSSDALKESTTLINPFSLILDPKFPRSHQETKAHIESYNIDLKSSIVRWYINGKQVEQGLALTDIKFMTGGIGEKIEIRVVVVDQDSQIYDKKFYITPSEVELLWQANTYTPPFYKGKALFTNQADLKITAIPSGKNISAKDLIYTWRKDGKIIEGGATLGKNSIIITGGIILRSFNIMVTAESSDGSFTAESNIDFSPKFPEIITYQNHPTRGILFNQAVTSLNNITDDELSISAFPYYFSTPNRYVALVPFTWSINGNTTSNTRGLPEISIKNSGKITSATIDISATHNNKEFQTAKSSIDLNFANN